MVYLRQKLVYVFVEGTPRGPRYFLVNAPPSLRALVRRFGLENDVPEEAPATTGTNWNYRPLSVAQVNHVAQTAHRMIFVERGLRQKGCFPMKEWTLRKSRKGRKG